MSGYERLKREILQNFGRYPNDSSKLLKYALKNIVVKLKIGLINQQTKETDAPLGKASVFK
jgi:hypothetical protein